ncbi:KipI antagonist [Defluviimonas aquaemixtae]|uniref:KipI antagonist n=1 Tax=Albidovulum aquaemixtae TaxID=1542388 RepID=A0A2R8BK33_9RHOB|nr:urea amidolyase [Defluviimonas aquaemixtae]SPH23761.1 KipI antagonist [Defluviimonas aquaemixtae]
MTAEAIFHRAGPGLTIQDLGRPGHISRGLSQGGAADRLALFEAAALLALSEPVAGVEMAGLGGEVSVTEPTRIALTGAPMRAAVDGRPLPWHASHMLEPSQRLSIGGAEAGAYGYLTFAGGIATNPWLGSRSAHLAAGIGERIRTDDRLPIGPDPAPGGRSRIIDAELRFSGGKIRVMPGPQTMLFTPEVWRRFLDTAFQRATDANRQGVRLSHDGACLAAEMSGGIASDFIGPGDIQMTGEGVPFVLLSESQTTGGYPRIATVIAADLPRVAQAPAGSILRFTELTVEAADALWRSEAATLSELRRKVRPLTRDPREISDLLAYQLISGATSGDDLG